MQALAATALDLGVDMHEICQVAAAVDQRDARARWAVVAAQHDPAALRAALATVSQLDLPDAVSEVTRRLEVAEQRALAGLQAAMQGQPSAQRVAGVLLRVVACDARVALCVSNNRAALYPCIQTAAVAEARALGLEQPAQQTAAWLVAQQARLTAAMENAAHNSAAAFAAAVDAAAEAGVDTSTIGSARAAFSASCHTALAALQDAAASKNAGQLYQALRNAQRKGVVGATGGGVLDAFMRRRRAAAAHVVEAIRKGGATLQAAVETASQLGLDVHAAAQAARTLLAAAAYRTLHDAPSIQQPSQLHADALAAWRAAADWAAQHPHPPTPPSQSPAASPRVAPSWMLRLLGRAAQGAALPTLRVLSLANQHLRGCEGLPALVPALEMLDVCGNQLTSLQGAHITGLYALYALRMRTYPCWQGCKGASNCTRSLLHTTA